MHLHTGTFDKFIPAFADFVRDEFAGQTHHFKMFSVPGGPHPGTTSAVDVAPRGRVQRLRYLFGLARQLQRADKVYLHSLFCFELVMLLFFMPWVLVKSHWFVWGGDLYVGEKAPVAGFKQRLKWRIKEAFRRPVIERVGTLVTYIDGDVELARQWYGAKGSQHDCFMYLSNVFKPLATEFLNVESKEFVVQVGNSGTPSNRHELAFEVLLPFVREDIRINVPLAYGEQNYIHGIVEQGERLFGGKFQPQLEFLAYNDYLQSLACMDAALFTHNRQQAMGNTIQLLGMGKKVYLSPQVTPWSLFAKLGIKVFDYREFNLSKLSEKDRVWNVKLVAGTFSTSNFRQQLAALFDHEEQDNTC